VHQAFLNAGGLGILVGDGQLPNAGSEKIIKMYYSFLVFSWCATFDYQFVANPAYNRDRGPVSIIWNAAACTILTSCTERSSLGPLPC
jgi:high affinity Mn2+ porin